MNEDARLDALYRYQILDTTPEPGFDDLTRLAARVCDAPFALVSLVDRDRQFFKAHIGTDLTETPRRISFCAHALQQTTILQVPDARLDPRFKDNPLVTQEPHVCFYAGAPLVTAEGHVLGTLCVLDTEPRLLTPEQEDTLQILARQTVAQLELRASYNREKRIAETLQRAMLLAPSAHTVPGLEVEPFYEPAWDEAQIGGDFYDVFSLPDGRVALFVGDVSGKGLGSSVYTARAKFALRVYLREGYRPAEAFAHLNDYMVDTPETGYVGMVPFVALSLVVLTPATGAAVVAFAAMEQPLIRRAESGHIESVGGGSIPLGVVAGAEFTERTVQLEENDLLLLMTDGITEARQEKGQLFGYERVEAILRSLPADTALPEVGQTVLREARAFSRGGSFADDVCMLLARRRTAG